MRQTLANSTVKSMTAFARTHHPFSLGVLHWEIRAINHRYLDINLKLPEHLRHLEMPLRDRVKQHLSRGKIDLILALELNQTTPIFQVNHSVLTPLSDAICTVQQTLLNASQVNPIELLKWPGVLNTSDLMVTDNATSETDIFSALEDALLQLNNHRIREGQALADLILQRCYAIETHVKTLQNRLPDILEKQIVKLKQRIFLLTEQLDEARLHQEIAIMAQKMDIEEELDRILTHLTEVRHVLNSPAVMGRRLDFLMQELNREANTLGSKAIDSQTAQTSIELKVLIEQIREQIQNIE